MTDFANMLTVNAALLIEQLGQPVTFLPTTGGDSVVAIGVVVPQSESLSTSVLGDAVTSELRLLVAASASPPTVTVGLDRCMIAEEEYCVMARVPVHARTVWIYSLRRVEQQTVGHRGRV